MGVDIETVPGTGPGGRVMRRDVEQHARGDAPPGEATIAPTSAAESAKADSDSPAPKTTGAEPAAAASVRTAKDPEDWERKPLRGVRRAIARHMSESRHTAAHFTY